MTPKASENGPGAAGVHFYKEYRNIFGNFSPGRISIPGCLGDDDEFEVVYMYTDDDPSLSRGASRGD